MDFALGKMGKGSGKVRKILGKDWTRSKLILKTYHTKAQN
jgi:hypothetical protein